MSKVKKLPKMILSLCLCTLLCINSFAAIVSDNDGAAFITKAEFDSLKNDFQSQLNDYNTRIDSKIDTAIASYLSGIKVSRIYKLSLDPNCNYVFPIYRDTNQYWDNNSISGGLKISYPEFHIERWLQRYGGMMFLGNNNFQASWATGTASSGRIAPSATSWPTSTDERYGVFVRYHHTYSYAGRSGLLNTVTRLSNTRKINSTNYNIYQIENEGIGRLVHSYDTVFQFSQVGGTFFGFATGDYASTPHSTGGSTFLGVDQYQYAVTGSGTSTRYNIKEPSSRTSSQPRIVLSKSSAKGYGPSWVNQGNTSGLFAAGSIKTCTQIGAQEFTSTSFDAAATSWNLWSSNPMAEATTYPTPNARRMIFSRSAFMPANANYNYALIADLASGTSTSYTIVGGGTNVVDEIKMWGTKNREVYAKPSNHMVCVPPLKTYTWHTSTKYAPGASEAFSYLPATLVSYLDSNGKRHYMDEGMYLGSMPKSGTVSFKVMFQRAYGSGSQVKLRISKKPFSYDFKDADLLTYKIENTNYTAANLNYNTTYTINISGLKEKDELYIEWTQNTTADLPYLTSLTDFQLVTDE